MLTTMKANLRKKHAEFPYVTPEEAADAIRSLIAEGINTFVSCTLDPREKSGNMGKVWEFIFLGRRGGGGGTVCSSAPPPWTEG
jgi:hypothetical protein